LEQKSKMLSQLSKRRLEFDLQCMSQIDRALASDTFVTEDEDNWFLSDVSQRSLTPACMVRYERLAFFLETQHNSLRLTIDSNLSSAACYSTQFADQPWQSANFEPFSKFDPLQFILQDQLILELKFLDSIPSLFKRLLAEFQIEPIKFSKYRTAMLPHQFACERGVVC
jgi:hypothetical protein